MEFDALLRGAAQQIDELDLAISHLNEDKKAVYQNIKETVPPAEFRAWKEAVKLRQKRRTDREKMDAHDSLVADMLHMLEQTGTDRAIKDTRARLQVHEEPTPPHDPATGEITNETPAASCLSDAGQEGGALDHVAPPSNNDPGDVPDFLDRRRPREETDIEFPILGEVATW
jgi:hypothetical protein